MHKALHSRDEWHRLCVKKRSKGLASIEDCIDTSIQGLKRYTKKSQERLIIAANSSNNKIKTEKPKLENRNGKKNNCMDTSSDKLGRLHMKRPGHG